MPPIASQTTIDPLNAFIAGAFASDSKRPVPLISTSFDVSVDAGLATVVTKRVFRNDEQSSIEATITFPIPVHATLFALEARINGRELKARAQPRTEARDNYENAVERGKAAVLHEEVLRGVHMLSVGHIAPGAEVEVSTTWATTLTVVGGRGFLRIPLTVGDIYGRSSLPDSDELIHRGPTKTAELAVRCGSGSVSLAHGGLKEGRAKVVLNAPIELVVTDWIPRELRGRAADGREVILHVDPLKGGDMALNIALLIDHSGSMGEVCSGNGRAITKHQVVRLGLRAIADKLRESDFVDLWEFDDSLTRLGSTNDVSRKKRRGALDQNKPGARLRELAAQLSGPAGGTEIGDALADIVEESSGRDVLLITDGKSYALDVQTLAQTGRRFSVVLVGEDSLEANVGYLAALTGGEIFVVAGEDLRGALAACMGTLRRSSEIPAPIVGELQRVKSCRSGALLSAEWRPAIEPVGDTILARAVAAVAASLALPALSAEAATSLAAAEGLVTHLTSLVLVDEAAEIQDGVPGTRKIALPTPRTAPVALGLPEGLFLSNGVSFSRGKYSAYYLEETGSLFSSAARRSRAPKVLIDLSPIRSHIEWDIMPKRLLAGDLSAIAPAAARMIELAAALPQVIALARRLNIEPSVLVLTLLARTCASTDRSAARIVKAVLGETTSADIEALGSRLGLSRINEPWLFDGEL